MMRRIAVVVAAGLTVANQDVTASFTPLQDTELVSSDRFPGTNITYRRTSLCETSDGVSNYAGYVHMPKSFVPDASEWEDGMSAKVFFWFFEARNDPDTAPTAIYMSGGPGSSAIDGSSNFPCFINPDSNSTTLNEHSWNSDVNVLYIDQPLGTGFSYVTTIEGFMDLTVGPQEPDFIPLAALSDEEASFTGNASMLATTLDSRANETLAKTTNAAGRTLWRFAQVWFNDFPELKTSNDEISIWSYSYGGYYAPIYTSYFLDQNELVENGDHDLSNATSLNVKTVGLLNGCVDMESMTESYLSMAVNNTYDIQAYDQETYNNLSSLLAAPEQGCWDLLRQCREAVAELDPEGTGEDDDVNEMCTMATEACFLGVQESFYMGELGLNEFDIAQSKPSSGHSEYEHAFWNQAWVQQELGVPLNWTASSLQVATRLIMATGDPARHDLSYLGRVLDAGVNVALVYGDRDYRCNWYGGENASLHIPHAASDAFGRAGYAAIETNSSYEGGMVREHGNLSFARVYQAGHAVAAYQPETVWRIFQRATARRDVATGQVDLAGNEEYATEGPGDISDVENEDPGPEENVCYVYSAPVTCTDEQRWALGNGTAVVEDWVVTDPKGTRGPRGIAFDEGGADGEGSGGDGDGDGDGDGSDGGSSATRAAGSVFGMTLAVLVLGAALYE